MIPIADREPLGRDFYMRPAEIVAPELLGAYLVRQYGGEMLAGKIVEVEAYPAAGDEASHSFIGKTKRNEVLFGEAGRTYIYQIHRYYCMDIATEGPGVPGSVLIRAVEPAAGLETMLRLRGKGTTAGLTGGPGRLCQALAITREQNGVDVTEKDSPIRIVPGEAAERVAVSPRVGVTKAADKLLRFTIG